MKPPSHILQLPEQKSTALYIIYRESEVREIFWYDWTLSGLTVKRVDKHSNSRHKETVLHTSSYLHSQSKLGAFSAYRALKWMAKVNKMLTEKPTALYLAYDQVWINCHNLLYVNIMKLEMFKQSEH